jgi:hypothetical protein
MGDHEIGAELFLRRQPVIVNGPVRAILMIVINRPWTRVGVISIAGHLGYELGTGVGVPLASRVGVTAATAGYTATFVATYRAAERLSSPRGDALFAVANGLFLSAVVSHFTSWPRTTRAGLPWLVECEGLRGPLIGPYNTVLHVSGLAALAGLVENRGAWRWGALTTAVVVPILRWAAPREYAHLLAQAERRPRWWNRRLATPPARRDGGAAGHAR